MKSISDRFWSKVDKTPECWNFCNKYPNGYGRFWIPLSKKYRLAHRLSWEMENGPIRNGLQVLHRCDNRACIRPNHLFLGTQLDNVRDTIAKGRYRFKALHGADHGRTRLSESDVMNIRQSHASRKNTITELAKMFSMAQSSIRSIVKQETWRHVAVPHLS